MKLKTLPFLLALLFALRAAGVAQDLNVPGTLKVTTSLNKDGTKTIVQTNPADHTAETTIYDASNKLVQKTILNLDDAMQPTGGLVYVSKGVNPKGFPILVLVYSMRYKRDSLNRLSEVENYSGTTEQLISRQVYHYDGAGHLTKIDNYDPNGNLIGPGGASQGRPDRKN